MPRHLRTTTAAWMVAAAGLTGGVVAAPALAAGPPATPPAAFAAPNPSSASPVNRLKAGATARWGTLAVDTPYPVEGIGFTPAASGLLKLTDVKGRDVGTFAAGTDGRFATTMALPAADVEPGHPATIVACVPVARTCRWIAAAAATVAGRGGSAPPPARATTTTAPRFTAATTTTATTIGELIAATTATPSGPGLAAPTTIVVEPTYGTSPDIVTATTYAPPTVPPHAAVATTKPQLPAAGDASLDNLRITALEVTQGLQDLQNRFPLVANRRTWVRVHARTDGDAPMPAVHAALEGVRNGQSLGLLQPERDPVTLVADPVRRLHDNTPYFVLPDAWAAEGSLTLRAWIYQGGDVAAGNEPTSADNLATAPVTFHAARPVSFYLFPLYLTEGFEPGGDPVIHSIGDGYTDAVHFARRLLPVDEVTTWIHPGTIGDESSHWDLSDGEDADPHAPNAVLQELHELGDYGDTDIFVGMVDTSLDTRFGGLSSGAQSIWVKMDNWFGTTSPWNHDAGGTLAHETGHAFDLKHAPCLVKPGSALPGEVAGGAVDPLFPGSYAWPDCSLAPTDLEGFYGFDPRPEWAGLDEPTILTNSNDTEAPNLAFPWMGYKGSGWLDPYHGCKVLQFLDVPCDPADLGVPAATGSGPSGGGIPTPAPGTGGGGQGGVPIGPVQCLDDEEACANKTDGEPSDAVPSTGGASPYGDLVVVGHVDPATGTAQIVRATRVPEHRTDGERGDATHQLVVRATDGTESRSPFRLAAAGHGPVDPNARRWFVTRTAAPADLASIAVTDAAGVELGRTEASAHAPTVAIDEVTASPDGSLVVRWSSADADGDAATALVQVRGIDGGPWQTIGSHLTASEVSVGADRLLASGVSEVRVLAGDGVLTSDAAVHTLAAPVVGTLAPVIDEDASVVVRRAEVDHSVHAGHGASQTSGPADGGGDDGVPVTAAVTAAVALGALGAARRRRHRRA